MSAVDAPAAAADQPSGRLRRELHLFEALAISVGIMAPTAAMALNGVAPAGLVGRAVPLAFLFAAIAIALVSYAFIRLTSYFNHAGSAYALVGVTVGPLHHRRVALVRRRDHARVPGPCAQNRAQPLAR
jgi:amino acid transporter